ncbi:T9SS sorting signal type C domain-containing protein [Kaistella antarctica]|uniref:Fibronectin type-III domain-containing protein n=1 Tax=Kaistella antarctica TaxID=266748 RepID=A0A3S4WSP5_9FLAO|nr:T9SS sorting signal type C domain-containing protein [Kaistella antarctica]KEY18799.1 hypothetical protein HY04_10020 [Kaistella antarctica]SEW15285.1 hypothetical protein SAMN05421765_2731 [Kaistella antarctica]VEH99483.1 Uncharacterised protein [Kaistella antarctica]
MKKFLLYFALIFLPLLTYAQQDPLAAPLSGTYIIGTGQPAPFNTLTNAVNKINTVGVAGPVVFLLNDVAYTNTTGETFPIKINQFVGTGLTNTLTIKPNTGKTVTITGTNINGFTGLPAIIQIDGGDNIIINGTNSTKGNSRDLTIKNNDNVTYAARTAVWISSNGTNAATNISILNTKLQMVNRNNSGLQLSGIFSGSNSRGGSNGIGGTEATAQNLKLTISNNEFINVRQGMIIRSSSVSALQSSNILFSSNKIGATLDNEKPSTPLDFSNVKNVNILNNDIVGVGNTTSADPFMGIIISNSSNLTFKGNTLQDIKTTGLYSGQAIWIKGLHTNLEISENKISNIKNIGNGPIYALYLDLAPESSGVLLTNNFVGDIASPGTTTQTGYGIYITNGVGTRIYHNTVALNAPQPGRSAAIYFEKGSSFDVRNNIFLNTSKSKGNNGEGPYAIYAGSDATFINIDHNNYYAPMTGYFGSDRLTLENWRTATGKDANSKNVNPIFVSPTDLADLHLKLLPENPQLKDAGANLLTIVPTDIDGQARTTKPDIGADEFSISSTVAIEPTAQSTLLKFTNITANSFNINWTKGNGANRIVVIRSGSAVNAAPVDGTAYTANPIFGSGSQIGTGNYVVYAGTANAVSVTGLSGATTYYVSVYEYNGTGPTANYLTTSPLSSSQLTLNAALGWQITNTNTLNTITFDATVPGVNVNQFQGNGIAPAPISGQLNSNSWAVDGFEDGAITFGGINTNPGFGRGISTGNATTGGLYAFNTSPNNSALGIQPTDKDFTPGTVTLRFQNQTSAPITSISLGYKVHIYNDKPTSSSFNFSHSADNATFGGISELDVISPATADVSPSWKASYRVATITGLNIPANGFYYLKWSGDEVVPGNAFDEFALDDISLSANPTSNFAEFEGIAENFSVHGNTKLSKATKVNGDLKFTAGKLILNGRTLTIGGTVTNTISEGLRGGDNSAIIVTGIADKTLSFDQTTPGTTNLINDFSIPFASAAAKKVLIANDFVVRKILTIGQDQILDLGKNQLSGSLSTITIDGTVLTQNTTATPFPKDKIWEGTGILHLNAITEAQKLVAGTYKNLTLSSTGGTIANANVIVNGILDLPSANPSDTAGSLSMTDPYILTMGPDATNTGLGDVTGIIQRNYQLVANKRYTFGHPDSSILFNPTGVLPKSLSAKLTIGTVPTWRAGAIKRQFDVIQDGAVDTKAIIRQHYLDNELNNNVESRLVFWANKAIETVPTFEQGRSNNNVNDNWVELTNADIGSYFENTFGKVFITLDQTEAAVLTWNGSESTDWLASKNWTPNDNPSFAKKIIIPNVTSSAGISPIINDISAVESISIEAGGIVNTPSGSTLTVHGGSGAWQNAGVFNSETGTVIFNNAQATIAGSTTFNNLTISADANIRALEGNMMKIKGAFVNNGTMSVAVSPNTIEFSGNNQTIPIAGGNPKNGYYNLTISGTNTNFPTDLNVRGNLELNQPVTFTGKTVNFTGDVEQAIGGSATIKLNNLVVDKPSGAITLRKSIEVNGTLTLTNGRLVIGSNDLTLGIIAVAGAPFDVNRMIVADGGGFVKRPFAAGGSYFFPIGELTSNPAYSPISVNMTSGSFAANSFVGVSVVDAIHPNNYSSQNYISRYWNVKQTGISNAIAEITTKYVLAELLSPPITMVAAQLTGVFNAVINPWIRFSPLDALTLTATGASLAEGQVSVFTGIKGGDFTAEITGGENTCQDEPLKLSAVVTGGDMQYRYKWSDELGVDLGTESTLSPAEFIGEKVYTVTVIDANGRKTTATKTITTEANATAGTLSGTQTVCFAYNPTITLTGNSAGVKYWQRSDEPMFLNPRRIANSTTELSGAEAGQITGLTYFRAAIDNGSCSDVFTTAIEINTKTTIWADGVWSNGIPNSTTAAVIDGPYREETDIIACSLTVIDSDVTIPAGYDVIIDGALIVDNGTFTLESNTNLVQKTDEKNYGDVTVERESSKLFRLDYTMWGSPVTGIQTLKNFSPDTQNSRFYTYNSSNDYFEVINPSSTFIAGKGYQIRMRNNHIGYGAGLAASWTGSFTGTPTNGPVTVPLDAAGQGYNMISNPYASMIDATKFLEGNSAEIGSTLYFWRRRNNVPTASAYYATYTTAGGTASASAPTEIPNGTIQVGQGFIIQKKGETSGNASFSNAMRTVNNNANQFFKNGQDERSRIWLNVTNAAGEFGQVLIAYMASADNGVDRTDGKYLNDGSTALTSWLDNSEYIIQGRAPFVPSDMVPLNFKTLTAGSYTIAIDKVDGLFLGAQYIYLNDKVVGTIHNLKTGAYTFATTAGSFNSRFELVYENGTLVVDNPVFDSSSVVLYKKEGNLTVKSKGTILDQVDVFDFAGRLLATAQKIKASEVSVKINNVNQVLIVKITSTDGRIISKKIIN